MKAIGQTKSGYKFIKVDKVNMYILGNSGVCDFCKKEIKKTGGFLTPMTSTICCHSCFLESFVNAAYCEADENIEAALTEHFADRLGISI